MLEWIQIMNAQVSSIDFLTNLENLKYVTLSENKISDISALRNKKKLVYLFLGKNKVTDVTPLSENTALQTIDLNDNRLVDINPLKNLVNLEFLDVSNVDRYGVTIPDSITNINELGTLVKLKSFRINVHKLTDIDSISSLVNLEYFEANQNKITKLPSGSALTKLKTMSLENNVITDINQVDTFKMGTIKLNGNSIIDVSPLYRAIIYVDFGTQGHNLPDCEVKVGFTGKLTAMNSLKGVSLSASDQTLTARDSIITPMQKNARASVVYEFKPSTNIVPYNFGSKKVAYSLTQYQYAVGTKEFDLTTKLSENQLLFKMKPDSFPYNPRQLTVTFTLNESLDLGQTIKMQNIDKNYNFTFFEVSDEKDMIDYTYWKQP
ncbi:MAG: leucine-rich repeat domain-containing protein, partial [Culicoidibacterales bacterium]